MPRFVPPCGAQQVIDFVMERKDTITSLVMSNSEGFWGDEGEYLSLSGKHNFQASHMGFVLGLLRNQLQVSCWVETRGGRGGRVGTGMHTHGRASLSNGLMVAGWC